MPQTHPQCSWSPGKHWKHCWTVFPRRTRSVLPRPGVKTDNVQVQPRETIRTWRLRIPSRRPTCKTTDVTTTKSSHCMTLAVGPRTLSQPGLGSTKRVRRGNTAQQCSQSSGTLRMSLEHAGPAYIPLYIFYISGTKSVP